MSLPTKLYLCGPMTGWENFNHPRFNQAAFELRLWGFQVFNPAENGVRLDAPWETHMRVDIVHLVQAEAVALLPAWDDSKGAKLEMHIARELGMRLQHYLDWIEEARKGGRVINQPSTATT